MNAATPNPALIVSPPYVIAPDLGVRAVDVSISGHDSSSNAGPQQPRICFGGHPAQECVIDLAGSGRTHDPVVEVDRSMPSHRKFVERVLEVLGPGIRLQVSPQKPVNGPHAVILSVEREER